MPLPASTRDFTSSAGREEACVEPDHELRLRASFLQDVVGDGLGNESQVGEGEGVQFDGVPAVGSESDGQSALL